jgi:uncharacterized small protein (DUF1192 family)
MDMDEYLPKKADDPLPRLLAQDLDPFSLAELQARITALENEIARVRHKINASVNHKASAEALFRK